MARGDAITRRSLCESHVDRLQILRDLRDDAADSN
jgi:hypothetical protein